MRPRKKRPQFRPTRRDFSVGEQPGCERINYYAIAFVKFVEVPSKSYLTAHSREISLLSRYCIRDLREGWPEKKSESGRNSLCLVFRGSHINPLGTPLPASQERCSRLTLSSFATLGPHSCNGTRHGSLFRRV